MGRNQAGRAVGLEQCSVTCSSSRSCHACVDRSPTWGPGSVEIVARACEMVQRTTTVVRREQSRDPSKTQNRTTTRVARRQPFYFRGAAGAVTTNQLRESSGVSMSLAKYAKGAKQRGV